MSGLAVILLVLVVALAIALIVIIANGRRAAANDPINPLPISRNPTLEDQRFEPTDSDDAYVEQIFTVPTDRPNEIYFFGPTAELDGYGSTLSTAPPQLARYAAGLRVGVDAGRSFAEVSGRLVLVDDKTAAALRAGTMMHDKAGEILAHTLRADGKIASVTRLRQVGGLAAGAASLTNALSAMAMQAQLDRIERQLSAISDGVAAVNRELLREWDAQTIGAQDMLREVYSTAVSAGELTTSNWSQITSIGQIVRAQIAGDRDRLSAAVADLERLVVSKDLKQRLTELDSKIDAVTSAHAMLSESTRTWAQFSALRLWHFTVTGDPTLDAYRQELETFIKGSPKLVEPLRSRASNAVGQITEYRWRSRARHPVISRRLPAASQDRLLELERVNWRPLELRQPGKEIELYVDSSGMQ